MSDESGKPEFIQPPTTLRDKVSVTSGGIDLKAIEQAEAIIAGMQGSYLEWVEEDLRKLNALCAEGEANPADRKRVFDDIFSVSHDVKGQGGSFNYPLMTVIGNMLCRFLEKLDVDEPKDSHMALVKVHVDAMRLVISHRMEGDGGKAGDNLVRGLNAALAKLQKV